MKPIAVASTLPFLLAAALLNASGQIQRMSAAQAGKDPSLSPAISHSNQGVVLSWFGTNGVPYQVEASSALAAWTNCSPVITGGGALLFFTNSIAGQSRGFFRVKCLLPADATSATFDAQTGVLTITGDELNNTIVVSRNASGILLVNGGAVTVSGGVPSVINTMLIQIFGRVGNDQLSLDEAFGALPKAHLFGEAGDDTLSGGSGDDVVNGGPGSDTLLGRGGADSLLGSEDHDTIIGGDGDDIAQLGTGNDRFIWNPGDDTDVIEGGEGLDTSEINGGNGAEDFTITANGTRVRFDRINPAPFFLDIGTCENLVLNANGGNDTLGCAGNLAALIQITADGGPGDDTLLGGNGGDLLLGGDNNDFIDGNQGNDTILLGAGEDVFQWDPGDGSDTVEGQAGNDRLLFNGSAGNENIDLFSAGSRFRLFRNLGSITLDMAGIESARLNAFGGTDAITVHELSATEVTALSLNLATPGGVSDAQFDSVIVHGTLESDSITAVQAGSDANITGLSAVISILAGDATDALSLNTLGGDDTVDASGMTTHFALTIDGGLGDDTITGGSLGDVLIGGNDRDTLVGGRGVDGIFGGNGDDTLVWNPGDGNDMLEGQEGTDRLIFKGANVSESIDAFADGSRLRLFRNVGNVVLDCDDVERVEVSAMGGADTVSIGELSSTDVNSLSVDLAAADGGGDAQPDNIIISGTQTDDILAVSGSPGIVSVIGLSASVTVANAESAHDTLTVNALGGFDIVDASVLADGVIQCALNGGLGEDILIGSQGPDTINGGDGDDLVLSRGGDDLFVWNPGDDNDTLDGEAGSDTLRFNGSAVGELIELAANGPRLRLFRNVASIVMDCDGVENVRLEAAGGPDVITVNDLSGTDVTAVNINLASIPEGSVGDGQPDSIVVNATAGDDTMALDQSSGSVRVTGLSATVTVSASEAANDRITVNGLAGADLVDAGLLPAGLIGFVADGGANDDVLIGSGGDDTMFGGLGDDLLLGGPGLDVLDGGPGDNIVIAD